MGSVKSIVEIMEKRNGLTNEISTETGHCSKTFLINEPRH
jgi:hypothetical protein